MYEIKKKIIITKTLSKTEEELLRDDVIQAKIQYSTFTIVWQKEKKEGEKNMKKK